MKRNKATGLDDLPPILLNDSAEDISAPLTYLINLSLATNMIPTDWKTAKIIPIHKPEHVQILIIIVRYQFYQIVHRQVMTFLDKNQLLSQFQFGFRSGLSTE